MAGVYIKGMAIPIEHGVCVFILPNGSVYSDGVILAGKAVSVPDHGRLVDADADPSAYVTVWECDCSEFGKQTVMSVEDLAYLPTIIPADRKEVDK